MIFATNMCVAAGKYGTPLIMKASARRLPLLAKSFLRAVESDVGDDIKWICEKLKADPNGKVMEMLRTLANLLAIVFGSPG